MAKGKKDDGEDEYSAKLDMCLTDGIVKTGDYYKLMICYCDCLFLHVLHCALICFTNYLHSQILYVPYKVCKQLYLHFHYTYNMPIR